MAAERRLSAAQHSARDEPRSAVGPAGPRARTSRPAATTCPGAPTGGRETIVTLADRGDAAVPAAAAGPGLDAVARRGLHRRLLPAADREAGRRSRSSAASLAVAMILRLDVGQRSEPLRRGRHRRRHQAADLRDRPALAFVVGDGRADAGRGLALSRLRLLLSLPLDRLAAGLAAAGAASPAPLWPLLSALLLVASSGLLVARRPRAAGRTRRTRPLRAADRARPSSRLSARSAIEVLGALARRPAPRRRRACRDGLHGVVPAARSWCWRSS